MVKVGQSIFTLRRRHGLCREIKRLEETATSPTASRSDTKAASAIPAASGGVSEMTLPALGENIEKGMVTKVLVKVGDALKKGTNILEIETDKAVLEVPSPSEGIVKEILIKSGAVIKVGQPIFKIEGAVNATPTRGHLNGDSPLENSDKGDSPH